MNEVNIYNNSLPDTDRIDGIINPKVEQRRAAGWRKRPTLPEVAAGYQRVGLTWIEGDGETAGATYEDVLLPPAPVVESFALPIAAPWIEVDSTDGGKGYAIRCDDLGNLFTVLTHASPRRTPAEIAQDATDKAGRIVAADTLLDEAKASLAACVTALDAAILELQAVDPQAFTGSQRTAIQALRSGSIAAARAAKDGVSATRKVRRAMIQRMRAKEVAE